MYQSKLSTRNRDGKLTCLCFGSLLQMMYTVPFLLDQLTAVCIGMPSKAHRFTIEQLSQNSLTLLRTFIPLA
jgi:hypothetical protein